MSTPPKWVVASTTQASAVPATLMSPATVRAVVAELSSDSATSRSALAPLPESTTFAAGSMKNSGRLSSDTASAADNNRCLPLELHFRFSLLTY
jgi:hypothetical protein